MPKITIPIKEKHQTQGADKSVLYCPLALAVNDCLKPGYFSKVGAKDVQIFNSERRRIYISRQARAISKFYDDSKIERTRPDHIVLDLPVEFFRQKYQ